MFRAPLSRWRQFNVANVCPLVYFHSNFLAGSTQKHLRTVGVSLPVETRGPTGGIQEDGSIPGKGEVLIGSHDPE